jgi:hypothetical protein
MLVKSPVVGVNVHPDRLPTRLCPELVIVPEQSGPWSSAELPASTVFIISTVDPWISIPPPINVTALPVIVLLLIVTMPRAAIPPAVIAVLLLMVLFVTVSVEPGN